MQPAWISGSRLGLFVMLLDACTPTASAGVGALGPPAPTHPPSVAASVASSSPRPPPTERRPVTEVYHGTPVVDDYRWLEDATDPNVKAWIAAQSAHARRALDGLPHLEAIRARIADVLKRATVGYRKVVPAGTRWFVLKSAPPKQQPFLVVLNANADPKTAKVLLDPADLDPTGSTAIDFFVPSHDGKLVAVSLSKGGTESGDVTVIDVTTGKTSPEVVPRVNGGTAGGDVAWARGDAGFFYTRYPRAGERQPEDESFYQQVYFHPLGTDGSADRYELGRDLPRISEIQLDVDARSGRVLASVQRGDGGETSHYLRDLGGKWRRFTDFGDGIVQVTFAPKDELYLLSRKDSLRGKILRISAATLDLGKAVTVVPEAHDALVSEFWDADTLLPTAGRLYATYQMGGPSVVRAFDHLGVPATWASPLDVSATSGLSRDGESGVLFQTESFVVPAAWYRFDETTRTATKTALVDESPVSLAGYSVVREIAKSKDGTEVPLSILLPPGAKRDGGNACVVTGYGGYGRSMEPRFRPDNAIWLEQGVVVVVANLRGGGEFGEEWHRNGMLEKKQNVFDDFAAVLNHLVDRHYTNPSRLGIVGGSNGGLLMGATLVQHPDLFKAVVSSVGIYDCLREELLPNGAFNVTEFGTVKNPKEFRALYAYSPYHHVADGVRYPATLLITGENDPRVGPMQSRKMAARLQAATAGQTPVLLRTSAGTGHGLDTALDERILEKADATAFLMKELGVEFHVSTP